MGFVICPLLQNDPPCISPRRNPFFSEVEFDQKVQESNLIKLIHTNRKSSLQRMFDSEDGGGPEALYFHSDSSSTYTGLVSVP
ncbi:hypothetical protein PRBEI_2000384400 [Prionailurus iriomotensis]